MNSKERRIHSRLDYSGFVTFESSASMAEQTEGMPLKGRGIATDISANGLCLTTQDAVRENQIIKINLPIHGVPVQTPTLVMVRWVTAQNGGYKAGMMYVV